MGVSLYWKFDKLILNVWKNKSLGRVRIILKKKEYIGKILYVDMRI